MGLFGGSSKSVNNTNVDVDVELENTINTGDVTSNNTNEIEIDNNSNVENTYNNDFTHNHNSETLNDFDNSFSNTFQNTFQNTFDLNGLGSTLNNNINKLFNNNSKKESEEFEANLIAQNADRVTEQNTKVLELAQEQNNKNIDRNNLFNNISFFKKALLIAIAIFTFTQLTKGEK